MIQSLNRQSTIRAGLKAAATLALCLCASVAQAQTGTTVTGVTKTQGQQTPATAGLKVLKCIGGTGTPPTCTGGTAVYGTVKMQACAIDSTGRCTSYPQVSCGTGQGFLGPRLGYIKGDGTWIDEAAAAGIKQVPNSGCTPAGLATEAEIMLTESVAEPVRLPRSMLKERKVIPDQPSVVWYALSDAIVPTQAGGKQSESQGTINDFEQWKRFAAASVPNAASTYDNIFVDSADNKLKAKDSAGAVRELGGGTVISIDAVNLTTQSPLNFQDTATIDFTNPSAGNVQAAVKSGSITDAMLASNYSGIGACTNQVVTALNDNAAPTCTTITSAYTSGTFTPSAHTHAESEVTNLVTDLAAKLALAGGTMTGAIILPAGSIASPALQLDTQTGIYKFGTSIVGISAGNALSARFASSGVSLPSGNDLLWCSDVNCTISIDAGIERSAAAVLKVTDGSTGYGVLDALGFRISGGAASGNVLRGNGTNFVSVQLALTDLAAFSSANLATQLSDEYGTTGVFPRVNFAGAAVNDLPCVTSVTPGSETLGLCVSDADLTAIAALSTTGFPARTAADTWALRSFADTGTISWTNPAGVAGNPSAAVVANSIGPTQIDETANYAWTSYHDYTAIAAPATPGAGIGRLYFKTTAKMFCGKDDAGVETCMDAGGAAGAPVGASYIVVALDGTLTAERTLAAGVGLASSDGGANGAFTLSTASDEADFVKSGALTCGAATQGKMQVHTTPLQYCDNAATPVLQYSAYGDSAGAAKTGDTANAFFAAGQIEAARGGTGIDTSASTGIPYLNAGTWAVGTAVTFQTGVSGRVNLISYLYDTAGIVRNLSADAVTSTGTCTGLTNNSTTTMVQTDCTSGTGADAIAGWSSAGNTRYGKLPHFVGYVRPVDSAGTVFYWVGMTTATISGASFNNADPSTTNTAAFRLAIGTDTNWQCYLSNGSASTVADSGVAATFTGTTKRFEVIERASSFTFKIEGNPVCEAMSQTNRPTSTAASLKLMSILNIAAGGVAKKIAAQRFTLEADVY